MIRNFTMMITGDDLNNSSTPLSISSERSGKIIMTETRSLNGGSAIGTFKINGNKIGGNPNVITSDSDEQEHNTNNKYQINDPVTFELTELTSMTQIYLLVRIEEDESDG